LLQLPVRAAADETAQASADMPTLVTKKSWHTHTQTSADGTTLQ